MSEAGFFGDSQVLRSARYENILRNDRFDRSCLIAKLVGEKRHVLELGCSTGFISRRLKNSDCYVVGVEIDPLAAAMAASVCDQVVVADLAGNEWLEMMKHQFEVILMGDVLEHLASPQNVLKHLKPLLLPTGCIVVSLPNVVHWTQRLKVLFGRFRYQSVGLLDFTHLRFFDLSAARDLIQDSGYDIEEFYPVIGGRFSSRFRSLWQFVAFCLPNLFAYQFLFKARLRSNTAHPR